MFLYQTNNCFFYFFRQHSYSVSLVFRFLSKLNFYKNVVGERHYSYEHIICYCLWQKSRFWKFAYTKIADYNNKANRKVITGCYCE